MLGSLRLAVVLVALVAAACQEPESVRETPLRGSAPGAIAAPGQPAASPAGSPSGNAVAGIAWTVPPTWAASGPAPMRVATYTIPPAAGDGEGGELAVFFFGSGQGGDVAANLQRWYGQMEQPGGGSSAQAAEVGERNVGGIKVTLVSLDGTYLWSPRPMSSEKVKKPGYRLLGAIAEAPGGNVFFKLTAPRKTAAAAGFDSFIASIHRS